ncbi:MAG: Lrp/AsnC family transcriptional regulator [Candidatus Woesearchaeota archaeon]|jgi:DNA-binding Lrp family transcriptional regulator|nr:Lrp/AsnC family transcriptional regulator [Candidatus Woesearchaeota archaeon]MDP7506282.1 Lrp/AsnC family transcriptional regulator [Candidatus Woesearchaeota archaeon]|tara:strand:+ start:2717 stop:3136 length:420 start_codon:yes stop_codon:yes gene_type:complete
MLSKKDQKIISVLKEDSRKSIRDIAKLTKLRPSTVHLRLQKLKKEGIIEKFTVKLDNKAVDENFIVFLFVTTEDNLSKVFLNTPNIKEVFGITGEYDLLLKLKFKDIEEFNKFLINLRKNKNIRKTLTMVSTVNVKEEA